MRVVSARGQRDKHGERPCQAILLPHHGLGTLDAGNGKKAGGVDWRTNCHAYLAGQLLSLGGTIVQTSRTPSRFAAWFPPVGGAGTSNPDSSAARGARPARASPHEHRLLAGGSAASRPSPSIPTPTPLLISNFPLRFCQAFGMESILVIILLLATHAAFGTASVQRKREDPCQHASFAREISVFCVNNVSIPACCESVIASVDIEGNGTATCLCRVAAEPQLIAARLNTDDLLTIFGLCRALATGGPSLEVTCEGVVDWQPLPTTEITQNSTAIGTGREQSEHDSAIKLLKGDMEKACNVPRLAFQLYVFCSEEVITGRCCKAVVSSINIDNIAKTPCICRVVDSWVFLSSGLGLNDIVGLYGECTGRQGVHRTFEDVC